MIRYIMWQVKNDFPENITTMNAHLYEFVRNYKDILELELMTGDTVMNKKNNKLAQLRKLQKDDDKSLQNIIDKAFEILGNPLILNDLEWVVLAYSEFSPHGIRNDKYIKNGKITDDVIEQSRNVGFLDAVIRPDKVLLFESEEFTRICGKIYDKNGLPVATLTVDQRDRPFEDIDFIIVEKICKMLAKEICEIPYYQNFSQKISETHMTKLIDGVTKSEMSKFALERVEMIYKGLKENLYVAVADISQCDPTYAKLEYYRNLFKQTRPAFKYFIYANYMVFIMSTDEPVLYPRRILHRLNKLFEQENISVGISSRFENLFELSKYYNEAVIAVNSGLKGDSGQRIFLYDNDGFRGGRD